MPQSVLTLRVPSRLFGEEQTIALLSPDRLDADGRCRVIYFLHGMGGDHTSWPSHVDLAHALAGLPIAAVMPSAGLSFYLDSEVAPMESYICRELIPFVDECLPTCSGPRGRALTGLSMGGYGALLLGLRHPDLFGSAASHSGAVLTARATTEVGVKWELADTLYGAGPESAAKRREHDILSLALGLTGAGAECAGAAGYRGPALYLDCGQSDFLMYASRELTQAMRMLGVPYEYHDVPGDHDWEFWRTRLPDSIAFHRRCFGV